MNKVVVVNCPDYDQVEEKLSQLLDLMGGIERFVSPGERIALKVNLLSPRNPDKAVTTHPAVVAAVGRLAKDAGGGPVIAESPGSGYQYNENTLRKFYRICGMAEAAEKAGIEVNWDTTSQAVSFPEGDLIKRFDVITPIVEADGVLSLCKLKTHAFMRMTGAVKNTFGVIPGVAKPGYHAKLHDTGRFAGMLLDLSTYVAPRLSIMDAVLGMEGEGPGSSGTPRPVGLLLASESPLALDVVAGEIMGLDREDNPVLMEAQRRGLSPTRLEEIELVGADPASLRIPGFRLPTASLGDTGFGSLVWWQKPLVPLFRAALTVRPRIVKKRCIACGTCRDACPMHAITIVDKKHARIDDSLCIRCYCCHEMCPADAIDLRRSPLHRAAGRLFNI